MNKNHKASPGGHTQAKNVPGLASDTHATSSILLDYANPEEKKRLLGVWKEAEEKHGNLLKCKKNTDIVEKVNAIGVAAFLAEATGIVFVPTEKTLWLKEPERGLWLLLDEDELVTRILESLNLFIREVINLKFEFVAKQSLAIEIVKRLKHYATKQEFFEAPQDTYLLHCLNCFLLISTKDGSATQYPLTEEWIHSRHQLNVVYTPEAQCPRFLKELLSPIITQDESRVLFDYLGQVLLGHNISQKILILSGVAGGGKSTIVNIFEMMLGRENVAELRTNALHGWYETSRYIGKSLLVGKDVPADFMRHHGASKIKALTGNDLISTEKKHSNEVSTFAGTLNVIITSNCNQPIMLKDDRDAWERRVLSIKCKQPEKKITPIRDFDKILVKTEGPGILNLALEGLKRIIEAGGTIVASAEQKREIEDLLDESEGVPVFLNECIEKGDVNENMTSWELFLAYKSYCQSRGWKPKSVTAVQKELPDAIATLFDEPRRTDIIREGTPHRGYWHIRLKSKNN